MPDSPERPLHGWPERSDSLHPRHDAVPHRPVPTHVVAEWEPGTFLENLAPDGNSWLVTSPSDHAVYRVSTAGEVGIAARFAGIPTGIVSHPGLGVLVAVGTQGRDDWRLHRVTADGPQDVCALPDVLSANGMTWAWGRLFVVDSGRSRIVSVDVTTGEVTTWLEHDLLTPLGPDSPLPGVNGLAIHRGTLIVSSSDRGLILKVSAASPHPAADLEILAERLVGDDLCIAEDGRIFIATHTYHSVLCLHPNGIREDVAVHADGIAGPTATSFGPGATPALYVTTSGGLLSPPAGEVESARLVRVDVLGAPERDDGGR